MRKIVLFAFALALPFCVKAQDGRLEINAGFSTPGLASVIDRDSWDPFPYYYTYRDVELSSLEDGAYNSTIYPSVSAEFSYKLADAGFFKRLDLVGFIGYHVVQFEDIDIISNTSTKETTHKADLLIGVRYNIIKTSYFNMYTQCLAGGYIGGKSRFWSFSDYNDGDGVSTIQLTYLGFRIKLGRRESKLGAMVELGYGSEYAADIIPVIPGVRTGLSYKF